MKRISIMAGVVLTAIAISSCSEDTSNIGESLIKDTDKLDVTTEEYEVSTQTVVADSVFTLSNNCYLGFVRDPETMADVKSEFTTQFHYLEHQYVSPDSKFISRVDGKAAADSCEIILYLTSPYNSKDSLSALKMKVHELKKPMEEGVRYYSNYNPMTLGMIREDGLSKSKMFTFLNLQDEDTLRTKTTYINNVRITLNSPYTDVNGNVYNNYGTYILRQYHEHPENFRNSYTFSHNVCPGFFFQITDGYGFYARVRDMGLKTYYRVQTDSGVVSAALTLAGTKEVLQTTFITNDKQAINKLAAERNHTYLKSPAGLFTEVTLPVKEIKKGHEKDSLIAAKITFQRINNQTDDERKFNIPQNILMLQKDSLNAFFENNKTPDNKMSYYAIYNYNGSTYKNSNTYNFTNISNLITSLWNIRQKGVKENPNWEAEHPNWNKVLLVPISYNGTSSTSTDHDMSLTSACLVGGPDNDHDPVTISVVYAKFKEQ